MTKDQKLDFIRQKCIEANPSILDLKFGCNVIVRGIANDNPGCQYDIVIDDRIDEHGRVNLGYFGFVPREDIEIEGRDIGLADVIYTVDNTSQKWPLDKIENITGIAKAGMKELLFMLLGNWNLLKPLHEQDEQLINFVYDLLKTN